jgi:oxalate decarboxylase/phosphoglucose isomerase-like protein (cupin superfamily)
MNTKAERHPEPRFIDVTPTVYADERGWAAFPWDHLPQPAALDAASLHVVVTEPGRLRGNHLHPAAGEWLYVFSGEAELAWPDIGGERRSRRLSGHQTLVYIPPGLPHALLALGDAPLWLVAGRDLPGRPTAEHTRPAPVADPDRSG